MVSQQTDPLVEQVRRLEEEHGNLIADVRLQVEDLESRRAGGLSEFRGRKELRRDSGPAVWQGRQVDGAGLARDMQQADTVMAIGGSLRETSQNSH